jgi:hypothetical protein
MVRSMATPSVSFKLLASGLLHARPLILGPLTIASFIIHYLGWQAARSFWLSRIDCTTCLIALITMSGLSTLTKWPSRAAQDTYVQTLHDARFLPVAGFGMADLTVIPHRLKSEGSGEVYAREWIRNLSFPIPLIAR